MGIVAGHGRSRHAIEPFNLGPRKERGRHIRAPTDERPENRHAKFSEDHA